MYALDFEYDGQLLSDFGLIICTFGSPSDYNTISAGSKITFNKVSRNCGKRYSLAGTTYEECISSTFQICKNPCVYEDRRISQIEYRKLVRWLNRHKFLKFMLISNDEDLETGSGGMVDIALTDVDVTSYGRDDCHFYASFNIEKITMDKEIYGLELTMETNAPFGFGDAVEHTFQSATANYTYSFEDTSDEIGYIYPDMTIQCLSAGTLTITNDIGDCSMVINNCTTGEIITISGDTRIVSSSLSSHKLYDDFNFDFFRVGNTYSKQTNNLTISLPSIINMSYEPIIKDAPESE